ncbi:MAG: MBL fold metallo-hydrolase [Deltaproteobacteria bacterium]|nr:MBL fold metallo-hydrolase [Deltaproteobacteria bacterium]
MKYIRTGKVIDDFYVVGNETVPVYLLDGPVPVLFDAGLTALGRRYEADIRRILGDRTPGYLFLTHSHFDHIGAAAHLKSVYPTMKIAGSERTQEILQRDKAVQLIRSLNQEAAESLESLNQGPIYKDPFKSFDLDLKLKGGEIIELASDVHIEVMNAPGHTWDFISYWVPEKKLLIASEAVGCDDGSGYIFAEFLVDYDAYVRTLTGLNRLDVNVLCQGHKVVLTGPDARKHMQRSLEQAPRYLAMVEEFLKEEQGDIERTADRVKAVEWDPKPWPKQTESAYVLNTRIRVGTIRQRMEQEQQGLEKLKAQR